MSERDALMRAVIDDPDDDLIRHVFADWLDDHGETNRAEFIRSQVRLAEAPAWEWAREEAQRGRFLHYAIGFDADRPALPAGVSWLRPSFHRGFPGAIEAGIPAFLEHAERLFALASIQRLQVDGRHPSFVEEWCRLTESPWLRRLRSLEVHVAPFDSEEIRRLGDSPHAVGLRRLSFEFCTIRPAAATALAASPLLAKLKELDLSHTDYADPVGPAIAAALGQRTERSGLNTLRLRRTRLGSEDAGRLAQSPALTSLTDLDLSECSFDRMLREDGWAALAESPRLSALQTLRMAKTEPRLGGMRALAGSKTWTDLRYLDLRSNRLGSKAVALLAEAPCARNLIVLRLGDNPLTDSGVRALVRLPSLSCLEVLDLSRSKAGDEAARALLGADHLTRLVELDLSSTAVTPALMGALRGRFGEDVVRGRG